MEQNGPGREKVGKETVGTIYTSEVAYPASERKGHGDENNKEEERPRSEDGKLN